MDYLYDGTFEGLLTCVYFHYKVERTTGIYEMSAYQQSFVSTSREISTDIGRAKTVSDAIVNKISYEAYLYAYYCFLSDHEHKENEILNFLIFGFKYGRNTMNFHSQPQVLPIKEAFVKVEREAQKFRGILRFADIGGVLYAAYSPDNDLTILLIEHFADRYKFESFIIHDLRRKKAAVYSNQHWEIKDISRVELPDYSEDETMIRKLWKQYFLDLAIKERTNINLQFQFVPARYRKDMVEFIGADH